MTRVGDIRRGLKDRLDTALQAAGMDDVQGFAFTTDQIGSPPAYVIQVDRQGGDLEIADSDESALYSLLITVVTNRIEEETAQDDLDTYFDPAGPFIAPLRAIHGTLGDYLDNLDGFSYVRVMRRQNPGQYQWGDATYYGEQLAIKVMA